MGTLAAKRPLRRDSTVARGVQVVPSRRSISTGAATPGATRPVTCAREPSSIDDGALNAATRRFQTGCAWAAAAAGTIAAAARQAAASAALRPSLIVPPCAESPSAYQTRVAVP